MDDSSGCCWAEESSEVLEKGYFAVRILVGESVAVFTRHEKVELDVKLITPDQFDTSVPKLLSMFDFATRGSYSTILSIAKANIAPAPNALTLSRLISLPLPEHVTILLQRTPVQLRLLPQIGRQESVAVTHGDEGSLERVLESLGRAGG